MIHSETNEMSRDRNRGISGIGKPGLYSEETFEWLGSWDNRFGQDRAAMATKWGGFQGLEQEDAARDMQAGKAPKPLPSVTKITGVADADLPPGGDWRALAPNHVSDAAD